MVTITKEDAAVILRLSRAALTLCGEEFARDYNPSLNRLANAILNEKNELAEAMEILRKVNLAIESGGRLKAC